MIITKSHILSYKTLFLGFSMLFVLLSGCAQENPLLYDPSLRDSSVSVRFINMSRDNVPRSFTIDGCPTFLNIAYGTSSDLRVNTIDSAHYSISKDSLVIFSTLALQRQKMSFFRNTIQTFISAGIQNQDSTYVLQLSTFRSDAVRSKAKIRIVNTLPDSLPLNVHLGCEEGEVLASFLSRGQISSETEILPGSNAISLVNATNNSFIGTFDKSGFTFSADSIYTIIVGRDPINSNIKVFVLNEFSKVIQAFEEFPNAGNLTASISVYNLISLNVDVTMKRGNSSNTISDNQLPYSSQSMVFSTCSSSSKDTIIIKDPNGFVLASESIHLSPYRSYSCIISRDILSPNGYSLIITENLREKPTKSMIGIRAINVQSSEPLALNSAARSIDKQYEAGSILYSALINKDLSKRIEIHAGTIPILVQTSSTPQIILSQNIGEVIEGKNYLLVIAPNMIFALQEDSGDIIRFESGAILQLIHGASKQTTHDITVGSILKNASLQSNGVFTTVIPLNRTTFISTVANTASITATDSNQRYSYIIDENKNILDYSYSRNQLDSKLTKLRVINLSPGSEVDLYLDYDIRLYNDTVNRDKSRDFNSQIRGIIYKQSSDYITIDRERRLSFSLIKWQNPPFIYAALNNLLISLGKNYSILLVPETDGSNRTIIRQEY